MKYPFPVMILLSGLIATSFDAVGMEPAAQLHQMDDDAAPPLAIAPAPDDSLLALPGTEAQGGALCTEPEGAATTTFCNTNAINFPAAGAASPYPSVINVAGTNGVVTDVKLRFLDVLHTNTGSMQLRLQHPGGQVVAINGSGFIPNEPPLPAVSNVEWRFSDKAQIYALFQDTPRWTAPTESNQFLPRNFAPAVLPAPGPAATPRQLLSSLEGTGADGVWSLWAAQEPTDAPQATGLIANGWCLDVTTAPASPGCYYSTTRTGSLGPGDPQQTGRITRDGQPRLCTHTKSVTLESNELLRYDSYDFTNPSSQPLCLTATADFTGCGGNQTMLVLYRNFNPAAPHMNVIGDSGYSTIGRISFSTRLAGNQSYTAVVHEVEPGQSCSNYTIRLEANTCLPPPAGDFIFANGFEIPPPT